VKLGRVTVSPEVNIRLPVLRSPPEVAIVPDSARAEVLVMMVNWAMVPEVAETSLVIALALATPAVTAPALAKAGFPKVSLASGALPVVSILIMPSLSLSTTSCAISFRVVVSCVIAMWF